MKYLFVDLNFIVKKKKTLEENQSNVNLLITT